MGNWSSWSEFAAMGGYGLYVWGSFAMCALVLLIETVALRVRRRTALNDALDADGDAPSSPARGVGA